jgi:hypothetical protein
MSLDATYPTHDHQRTELKTFIVLVYLEVQEQAYLTFLQAGCELFPLHRGKNCSALSLAASLSTQLLFIASPQTLKLQCKNALTDPSVSQPVV